MTLANDLYWDEASRDEDAEAEAALMAAASVEAAPIWGLVTAAASETDFHNRLALMEDRIHAVARSVAPEGSAEYMHVVGALPEQWFADWQAAYEVRESAKQAVRTENINSILSGNEPDEYVVHYRDGTSEHVKEDAFTKEMEDWYEAQHSAYALGSKATAASQSDVCPRCGEQMDDVVVYDRDDGSKLLEARCHECGWSGSKTMRSAAKTASGEDWLDWAYDTMEEAKGYLANASREATSGRWYQARALRDKARNLLIQVNERASSEGEEPEGLLDLLAQANGKTPLPGHRDPAWRARQAARGGVAGWDQESGEFYYHLVPSSPAVYIATQNADGTGYAVANTVTNEIVLKGIPSETIADDTARRWNRNPALAPDTPGGNDWSGIAPQSARKQAVTSRDGIPSPKVNVTWQKISDDEFPEEDFWVFHFEGEPVRRMEAMVSYTDFPRPGDGPWRWEVDGRAWWAGDEVGKIGTAQTADAAKAAAEQAMQDFADDLWVQFDTGLGGTAHQATRKQAVTYGPKPGSSMVTSENPRAAWDVAAVTPDGQTGYAKGRSGGGRIWWKITGAPQPTAPGYATAPVAIYEIDTVTDDGSVWGVPGKQIGSGIIGLTEGVYDWAASNWADANGLKMGRQARRVQAIFGDSLTDDEQRKTEEYLASRPCSQCGSIDWLAMYKIDGAVHAACDSCDGETVVVPLAKIGGVRVQAENPNPDLNNQAPPAAPGVPAEPVGSSKVDVGAITKGQTLLEAGDGEVRTYEVNEVTDEGETMLLSVTRGDGEQMELDIPKTEKVQVYSTRKVANPYMPDENPYVPGDPAGGYLNDMGTATEPQSNQPRTAPRPAPSSEVPTSASEDEDTGVTNRQASLSMDDAFEAVLGEPGEE